MNLQEKTMKRWMKGLVAAAVLAVAANFSPAQDKLLRAGDTVAIGGDSITEQKEYSVFIEDYLLMCQPEPNIRAAAFGWGGETAGGFLGRMSNDVLWLKPNVATTCYGMNDGGYRAPDAGIRASYKNNTKAIVKKFKDAGVRVIIVGSPGVVDADMFHKNPEDAAVYNKTLDGLREAAKEVAQEEGVVFADVWGPMMDVMTKAKAKYGKNYHLAGPDGVHPSKNGHLVMAYAYLKAMGCDGNVGTITVDLAGNKAEGSAGHKVISDQNGTIEIESTKYPFCFYGDPSTPNSTRSTIEFLPFNQELNRFTLKVTGASGKVKVTWGDASKEFDGQQLAAGINLAAEFAAGNPFSQPFMQVEQQVKNQQNYETVLHKQLLHNLPDYMRYAPEEKDSLARIAAGVEKKDAEMFAASQASVKPVKHTIKIEVVK
jgi:lysophospholipase L1-like esterase